MKHRAVRILLQGLLILAAWTLFGFFSASQVYLSRGYTAMIPWNQALRYALLDSYTWAALTPFVFWLGGLLVVRRNTWIWAAPLLLVAGLIFGLAHLFIFVRLLPWIGYTVNQRTVGTIVTGKLHADILTCWALFGIRHAAEYYRRYRSRELTASQLEARLATAQLEVLKMQIQPHFLFNTLHAISALMYRDVDGADRMITRLSDFLRLTLESAGVQETTLKREMEYLDKYLEIEQIRFGERLQVRRSIDPNTLDLFVPSLVLQPLVENAVRYGIAPRAEGGQIEISARILQGDLVVGVWDDGPGPTGEIREGVGISNTRARLEQLYGSRSRLELRTAPEGGFRAQLVLPTQADRISERMDASADRG